MAIYEWDTKIYLGKIFFKEFVIISLATHMWFVPFIGNSLGYGIDLLGICLHRG